MGQVPTITTETIVQDNHRLDAPSRILIVDDEANICDVCTRMLQSGPYHVVSTTDALFALQQLKTGGPFDLLLADIKMPLINGLELAERAREIDPTIAIIIMTGHPSNDHLRQAVQRGVTDFISKPFELSELRMAIDGALHKRLLLQDSLRLRAVEQLLQSSEAINATLEHVQLHQTILQMALRQSACQTGYLLVSDDSKPQLDLTQAADDTWQLLPPGYTIANETYTRRVPVVIDSPDALCVNGEQQIRRGLCMPLRAQGDVVGVLLLCDDRPEVFRPGIQEMVALLANHAGTALRNAHLYSKLQAAYQQLQELDRLKSEFIAIASHELRTPLSIVLGYAMMVRDQSHDDQREYAQRVLESAQQIKHIIDDMVSLRHLELGEVPLTMEECELQAIVSQAVERMQLAAQDRCQQLSLDLPPDPIICLTDREKLLLILGNLISNAIKFTPDGGQICITLAVWSDGQLRAVFRRDVVSPDNITSVLEKANNAKWVVIQVTDTGIGIPRREQVRIFERFYQVADSLTRQQGGTGLGLSIARELIALQQGIVWVESTEDQGSTFSFALPYRVAIP